MSTTDEIRKGITELKKELQEKAKALLEVLFVEFFKQNPEVEELQWEQCSPFFNDGDACEFSVHEAELRLKGTDEDMLFSTWNLRDKETLKNNLHELNSALQDIEGQLRDAFGEHSRIKVKQDGSIEVEDYIDHD